MTTMLPKRSSQPHLPLAERCVQALSLVVFFCVLDQGVLD